ncbi:45866_t:CDS:2 [Gigaspora margarita]|uniref:45866_t:CDS:1 n=1 Tax=Gigaspora margarita TaxID=4874 RepID=A0ABN7UMY5_GIGMA|nr:45866_t:CDS:2 [Gigaspora margarita]
MSVPLHIRKNLLPVHLYCSLGRTPNRNLYTEYRSLTGTMGYSHNNRAHTLYAGPTTLYSMQQTGLRDHFHDLPNLHTSNNETRVETYGNYIKLRLINIETTSSLGFLVLSPTQKIKAPPKHPPNTMLYTDRSNNKHVLTNKKTTISTKFL